MLESFDQPPHSMFFGQGYLQHAVAEYLGHENLRYHLNLCPEDVDPHESILCSYL